MPVPDEFTLCDDYMFCEICEKDYPLSTFKHVAVTNGMKGAFENEESEIRYCAICSECREKCKASPAYEQFVTEKVFNLKLGRRIR